MLYYTPAVVWSNAQEAPALRQVPGISVTDRTDESLGLYSLSARFTSRAKMFPRLLITLHIGVLIDLFFEASE